MPEIYSDGADGLAADDWSVNVHKQQKLLRKCGFKRSP